MDTKESLLLKVKEKIERELDCLLKKSSHSLVFGKGNPGAKLLFIGEAPGEQEDLMGIPFVGAAGRELDKLLHSIDLSLKDVYVANILKYRPPDNRNPSKEEIECHAPYLLQQIQIIQPKMIITLGNFATKFVLADFNVNRMKTIGGISVLHGNPVPKEIDGFHFIAYPLYHPAAILYNPRLRSELQNDFKKITGLIKDV